MPAPAALLKAVLQAIRWEEDQTVVETGDPIPVQFNPETLKLAYANRSAGGDQRGGSGVQFVGAGTTKLSLDLWFDVDAPAPDRPAEEVDDVRRLTARVIDFIRPVASDEEGKFVPPGMRFLWGTFLFEGIVDSVNESLEFFSEQGRPLRARLSLSLSQQEIQFKFGAQAAPGLGSNPAPPRAGAAPTAREGDSVQDIAARAGRPEDWQAIASRNDIDDPRQPPADRPLVL